jgi:hypothetical protein
MGRQSSEIAICKDELRSQSLVNVVIRNRSGNYLSGRNGGSTLTESRDMAYVYDYDTDDVEAYMTQAAKQYGGE